MLTGGNIVLVKQPLALGAMPIHLAERQFTLGEAATLSRVPHRSIRNWMARDVIVLGERHFLGRWMFSVLDVLKLAVMHDLCVKMTFSPSIAAKLAEAVAQVAWDSSKRDASGTLTAGADNFRPNVNVLLNYDEAGEPHVVMANIKDPGNYYPPLRGEAGAASLRRAHVVIPATAMLFDVLERTEEVTRRNVKAEVPFHD
jgi:hypothetical protein